MNKEDFEDKVLSLVNKFEKNTSGEDFHTFFIIALGEDSHMVYEGGDGVDLFKLIGVLELTKVKIISAVSPSAHFEGSLQ